MFKTLIAFTACCLTALSSFSFAGCQQSIEIGGGWRRDNLDWKLKDLESSYISADVDSHIHFKDIELYGMYAKAKWVGSEFYVRLSADYALSAKGRAKERFGIQSPLLECPITVETNDPVKRRSSEVYDFDGAVGYPFAFCNCRLQVTPLIGFSFHRQRIKVKGDKRCSCSCGQLSSSTAPTASTTDSITIVSDPFIDTSVSTYSVPSYYFSSASCSSSYFSVDSSSCNPFVSSFSSNPFSSPSYADPQIASAIGLSTDRRTSNYRFTWYGFYLGTDIAYALDPTWTIYTELECHFLNNCHRKRESWTGVYFVDDYHHSGWSYGFNTSLGTTFAMSNCWYGTLSVDYKWWKAHSHHDELKWQSVAVNAALAYSF